MRTAVLAVGLLLAAGACGGSTTSGSAPTSAPSHEHAGGTSPPAFGASEATTRVDVTMRDFAFIGLPASVAGPNLLLTSKVDDNRQHEVVVVDGDGTTVGAIPPFKKGATKTLAVRLDPGTYSVECLVKDGTKTHAQLGMKRQLKVT